MVNEIKYTSIQRVLDNLKDDPMMVDLTLEQVVRHAIRFIAKNGYPKLYKDKIEDVQIHDWRGLLPCDLISIVQVMDLGSHICLRSMTDSFTPGLSHKHKDRSSTPLPPDLPGYIPASRLPHGEMSFKTQGRIIFTSFPEGCVRVSYKAIELDEDGFPMLIDDEVYLDALESYIALKVYQAKFRASKIPVSVYQDVQQQYAVAAKLLETEMTTPSVSEMESFTRYFNSLIPRVREFDRGFKHLGDREFIRNH